jgi:uncharacterized protein (DUF885 family)
MRFTKKFINAICCFVLMTSVTACGTSSPGGEFQAILDEHWENAESEQVFFRTDPDAWRMNGKLAEFTAEARARRRDFNEAILARLETIDIDDLDPDNQVSYRLFLYERLTERDSYSQKDHFFPFSSLTGYHTYFDTWSAWPIFRATTASTSRSCGKRFQPDTRTTARVSRGTKKRSAYTSSTM